MLLALGTASAAWANAAAPTNTPAQTSTVIDNSNGSVTVTVTGSWIWEFSLTPKTTQGIDVSAAHPCDDRFGVGWAVIWNDPNDPGYPQTFQTANGKATVNLGSKSLLDGNAQGSVLWDKTKPCGTFVQTNTPDQGDGYLTGQWTATHTYTNNATVPASICGVMYDLGPGKRAPGRREQKLSQNDNSVWWSLYNTGTWSPTDGNPGCVTLSAPISPPPTTGTTAAVVVKTTPPTTPPATAPAHSLAFTGTGPVDDALGIWAPSGPSRCVHVLLRRRPAKSVALDRRVCEIGRFDVLTSVIGGCQEDCPVAP